MIFTATSPYWTMRSLNLVASACFVSLLLLSSSCIDNPNIDPDAQFAMDLESIDNHLAANTITAYKDATGIRYSIKSIGTGGLPARYDQQVTVKYTGRLLDGTEFESNTTTGFVSNFIAGWQRALPLLPKGTSATIFIPSGLAYGPQNFGPIPGNSVLVFDVVVEDVIVSASETLRAPSDIAAIDKYLADNNIVAVADTTGVRYTITQQGTGEAPGWFNKVRFKYTGKLLSGTEFFTGTAEPGELFDSRLVDFIHGITIALTKLSVGGKGTFYIPSRHAFGANASSAAPVPPNSNVIYEVELLEVYSE